MEVALWIIGILVGLAVGAIVILIAVFIDRNPWL